MSYRICIDVRTYVDREADEDDSWDRGDTWGYVERVYASNDDYDWSYRSEDIVDELPVYVVYATYRTGDTFGSDFEATVVGTAKTREEAEALATEARNFSGFGSLSNGFYVPWNGYFENLEEVYIEYVA